MTQYEKTTVLGVDDDVRIFVSECENHPSMWVEGKVVSVCNEGFEVQWNGLKEPKLYDFCKVEIVGNEIFEEGCKYPPGTGLSYKEFAQSTDDLNN